MTADRQGPRIASTPEGEVVVSEVFGPTIQGEGPSAGQVAMFVRLGQCNLSCTWCDTAYSWDYSRYDLHQELRRQPTSEIATRVMAGRAPLMVLTGGEPALQSTEGAALARKVAVVGVRTEVETNGSVPLGQLAEVASLIVVSPKLSNSGLPERARLRWSILETLSLAEHCVFKFVVRDPLELAEVDRIVARLGLAPSRTWIMPEGTKPNQVATAMRRLAPEVVARGWSLSGRLQLTLWGDKRGH